MLLSLPFRPQPEPHPVSQPVSQPQPVSHPPPHFRWKRPPSLPFNPQPHPVSQPESQPVSQPVSHPQLPGRLNRRLSVMLRVLHPLPQAVPQAVSGVEQQSDATPQPPRCNIRSRSWALLTLQHINPPVSSTKATIFNFIETRLLKVGTQFKSIKPLNAVDISAD